jgi:tripartite-type tricarboxylate transporter receptor subunit TctC
LDHINGRKPMNSVMSFNNGRSAKNSDHPSKRKFLKSAAAGLGVVSLAGLVGAQDNVLRLVIPYPPGGGSDIGARLIAPELAAKLGRNVIVENMTGAGGRVALQNIKRMGADADVLVLVNPALMVIMPETLKDVGYNVDADFQAVTQVSQYEMAVAVGAAVPVREINHLLAWMRVNAEKATFGVPATGSIPHFFALMMSEAAKIKAPVVGYRGSAPLLTDLVGGHVPVAIDALDSLLAQHEGGKIRILASSGEKRIIQTIPTLKESGLALSAFGWNTFYAKSTMSAEKVERYAKEIAAVMSAKPMRDKFLAAKILDPNAVSLADTRRNIAAFKKQWVPVIKASGLKFD